MNVAVLLMVSASFPCAFPFAKNNAWKAIENLSSGGVCAVRGIMELIRFRTKKGSTTKRKTGGEPPVSLFSYFEQIYLNGAKVAPEFRN